MALTRLLIVSSPCTLAELQEFINEARKITGDDMSVQVKVFGKDVRMKWPSTSAVDEGDLRKAE